MPQLGVVPRLGVVSQRVRAGRTNERRVRITHGLPTRGSGIRCQLTIGMIDSIDYEDYP